MAGLYEQIAAADGSTKLSSHAMGGLLREWLMGNITDLQFLGDPDADPDPIPGALPWEDQTRTQLLAIQTKFGTLSGTLAKVQFFFELEDVLILWETGHYPKAKGVAVLMD